MMTTWKIEITEPHSGELGEAVLHEDHGFAFEEYTYETGHRMDVAVHDVHDPHWHIFTDLDSGHRIKIPPEKYRMISGEPVPAPMPLASSAP
ncbi:hypothetical protein [Opitutus sp. ER46]|uniref:hypothetical protein n=1 Tax=Opitutus sp. ER46 TaxID=2161864 RepID=UPI000D32398D|nr:hypothetical protein [Opitutus sp. ER46]PTX97813.1 hypothetical protein DB354_05925 [Opitutus sp. ER46]